MSLPTRLAKLRAMPLAEIGGRIHDRVYRSWERRQTGLPPADHEAALRTALAKTVGEHPTWPSALLTSRRAHTLYSALDHRDELSRLLHERFPAGVDRAVARAQEVLEGRFHLFGAVHALGPSIDWHRAPGRPDAWPRVYHGDLEICGHEEQLGDVKEVWELNRHQQLVVLAKAWLVSRDDRYAAGLLRLVTHWIAANPVGVGVNWAGPLEVAYRALSWTWGYALLKDSLPDGEHLSWLASFLDHGRFLHRHLERYASPYNHLVGEAAVLYMLGVFFPEFGESAAWRRRGRETLEAILPEQFHGDGGGVEQATVYHHATLGFYWLAAVAGRTHGDELSPAVWRAIERATEFSMWMTQPDGRQPALGDNDDAWPIAFDKTEGWDYRHFLCLGAIEFSRGDFKSTAGRLFEEALWMLGPQAALAFDALEPSVPSRASIALPSSGYVSLRTSWDAGADWLLFDCGPQAAGLSTGAVPSAAHGHADCLAVQVALGGEPVLVDSAFFTYNADRVWERHFRETAAHNTVRVDGLDQAVHLDKMAWTHVPRATMHGDGLAAGELWASGSHDGFVRTAGVVHRRTVWLRHGYVALLDELSGPGPHEAEVTFLFSPCLPGGVLGSTFEAGDRVALAWVASQPVEARLVRGGDGPSSGWMAPALGRRVAVDRLTLSSRFSTPGLTVLSVIVDRRRWRVRPPDGDLRIVIDARDASVSDAIEPRRLEAKPAALVITNTTMNRASSEVVAG